ncbi:S-layer homology domain-containing protein [Cohnella ginsengisoli]|uniref:alpha-L-fucosidase n=1 Tax=Cohnella ginsengisoli TaxID=425004 RepID=A0A9X4KKW7_9BACL|nr:S-layer homology domain-containing protein [Cohnella ginsengisoli]MDG0791550.1 S-layer homology domain-containing protein [Cohnella ginsengisoli]
MPTNLALGKTVTASSSLLNSDWSGAKVVDGNTGSVPGSMGYTSSNDLNNNHNEWVKINLGASSVVNSVTLWPRDDSGAKGEGFPVDFTIQVSTDDVNWTTVVTRTGQTNPGANPQTYYFPPASATYVKVDATSLRQNLTNQWKEWRLQFAEIGVYSIADAPAPTITEQPQGKIVLPDASVQLSVNATGSGSLTYQWYSNTTAGTNGGLAIDGATGTSYAAPTTQEGTTYYYAVVTNTDNNMTNNKIAETTSAIAAVTVTRGALPPVVRTVTQPVSRTVYLNGHAALSVQATATGDLSYQWYSNDQDSTEGAVAVAGATAATLQVPTDAAGTRYYYAMVTNTDNSMPLNKTATATSEIVGIQVLTPGDTTGQTIDRTRAMKYGLFVHYVPELTVDKSGAIVMDPDTLADNFDANRFADDLAEMKVEYVIFTAWHFRMVTLWPSDAMKSWLPNGHTTKRDMLGDMITAVRSKGIHVLLYTHPRDGHDFNTEDQALSGWKVNGAFDKTKWNDFINDIYGEMMDRYGSRIDGIYLDEGGDNTNYIDYDRLRKTIKDVNPNVLMIQNNYYGNAYNTDIGDQEFFFWDPFGKNTDGTKWTSFNRTIGPTFAGNWWAEQAENKTVVTWTPESMFRFTVLQAGTNTDGLGIQWAAGPYPGGGFEKDVVSTMAKIGDYIEPIAESIKNTYSSTSYPTPAKSTIEGITWGVATRSTDDAYEYIHVLKAPSTKTLQLPAPKDGKQFGTATLLPSGHEVALRQTADGVTLTLGESDAWDPYDTVIKLNVIGKSANLALGKLVYASSIVDSDVDRWGNQKVTDGIYESIKGTSMGHSSSMNLTTQNHTESITVDLGAATAVSAVTLFPRSDAGNEGEGFPIDFTIKLSTDNAQWTTVSTQTGFANPGKVAQTLNFDQLTARYVKLEATKLKINTKDFNQYRLQLAEIGVYNDAFTPVFGAQPKSGTVAPGDTVKLFVTATATGQLSYQWYRNDANSANGGTSIQDATSSTLLVPTETAGTVYYYCVVTNTENNMTTGPREASGTSQIAAITVSSGDNGGGDNGGGDNGTDNPGTDNPGTDNLGSGSYSNHSNNGPAVEAGKISVKATADAGGRATVNVGADVLNTAVSKAAGKAVEIVVQPSAGTTEVGLSLPVSAILAAKKQGIEMLAIDTGLAVVKVKLDRIVLASSSSSGNIQLTVAKKDPSTLPEAARSRLGDHPVYDFTLQNDGGKLEQFDGKTDIQVEVSYSLKQGEDPGKVVAYSIGANGELEVVPNSYYDTVAGKLVFKPKHFSPFAIAYADASFGDIDRTPWARSGIEALAARGAIDGTGNGQFNPLGKVTRAEFLQMLLRSLELTNESASADFSDVDAGAWYYNAVASGQKLGIVSGRPDGSFGASDSINRQDAALMAYQAAQAANARLNRAGAEAFKDAGSIAGYASGAVSALHEAGIVNGAGGLFRPKSDMTRAEAAAMLYRLFVQAQGTK